MENCPIFAVRYTPRCTIGIHDSLYPRYLGILRIFTNFSLFYVADSRTFEKYNTPPLCKKFKICIDIVRTIGRNFSPLIVNFNHNFARD